MIICNRLFSMEIKCVICLIYVICWSRLVDTSEIWPPCLSQLGLRHNTYDSSLQFNIEVSSGVADDVRMNGPKAWRPDQNGDNYVKITTSDPVLLTAIQFQIEQEMAGRVTTLAISTSLDCKDFQTENYTISYDGIAQTQTVETLMLNNAKFVTCLILQPIEFSGTVPALRLELLGCVLSQGESCSRNVLPSTDETAPSNGRLFKYDHGVVLLWLQLHLEGQETRLGVQGDIEVYYSRSCHDWMQYEVEKSNTISVNSENGQSRWVTIEFDSPIKAKCFQIIPPHKTVIRNLKANVCSGRTVSEIQPFQPSVRSKKVFEKDLSSQDVLNDQKYSDSSEVDKTTATLFEILQQEKHSGESKTTLPKQVFSQTSEFTKTNSPATHSALDLEKDYNYVSLKATNQNSTNYESVKPNQKDEQLINMTSLQEESKQSIPVETSTIGYEGITKLDFLAESMNLTMENKKSENLTATNADFDKSTTFKNVIVLSTPVLLKEDVFPTDPPNHVLNNSELSDIFNFNFEPDFDNPPTPIFENVELSDSDILDLLSLNLSNITETNELENQTLAPEKLSEDSATKFVTKSLQMSHPNATTQSVNLNLSLINESNISQKNLTSASAHTFNTKCGLKGRADNQRMKRVIGGHLNYPGEWPWLASMYFLPEFEYTNKSGYKHACGASLIHPSYVLTAAHCFSDVLFPGLSNISNWRINIGLHDLADSANTFRQERLIQKLFLYPTYNITIAPLINDIAVLKLDKPVELTERASLVCLDNSRTFYSDAQCYVTGWGNRYLDTVKVGSRFPMTTLLTILSLDNCSAMFDKLPKESPIKPYLNISEPVLCARVGPEGQDTCQGDSGGPLMCEVDGQWHQVGLVAAGFGCGNKDIPALYSRISFFHEWIQNITEGEDAEI